uniref:Uncharacterized protein n=1 Tax=Glossina palpalis gambiensis TaxID=67801 RepID=A0A1B0BYX0_9MUSC
MTDTDKESHKCRLLTEKKALTTNLCDIGKKDHRKILNYLGKDRSSSILDSNDITSQPISPPLLTRLMNIAPCLANLFKT